MPVLVPEKDRQDANTIEAWCREAFPDLLRALLQDEDPTNLGASKNKYPG
jgi:hypothetical protein